MDVILRYTVLAPAVIFQVPAEQFQGSLNECSTVRDLISTHASFLSSNFATTHSSPMHPTSAPTSQTSY
jgi:hypothetical protein